SAVTSATDSVDGSVTSPHGGSYMGLSGLLNSQSTGLGTVTVSRPIYIPVGVVDTLSFWANLHCHDSVSFDWQEADVIDASGVTHQLFHQCDQTANNAWRQYTFDLTPYAGTTVTLQFLNHDDGYANAND